MGRSTTSCFNIISCGCINDSVNKDEENKVHDKPGWSFGRKSSKHQVPSSTVVTEKISSTESKEIPEPIAVSTEQQEKISSTESKEVPESITITSEPQVNISEKTSDNIWTEVTEETPNVITKNAAVSTTATKPANEEADVKCEPVSDESEYEYESAVLVIQAAVRRFLAERQLVKHNNVVKLQAAVRGHLVRSHAVGTLRCVQAIVKMQALVRARREKGVQNAGINSTPTHMSIEKLLSNRLARQLLESTPKTKQINIKCDPSKSDSAWNWLERWMSVSSPETLQSHTPDHVQDKVVNNTESEVKMVISANNFGEATVRYEQKENLINTDEDSNVKTHEEEPISESIMIPVSETKPEPIPESPVSETKPKHENPESVIEPIYIPENPESETESKHIPKNPESETEYKHIPKNPESETEPKPKPIPENPVSETKPEPIPKNPVSETKPEPIPKNPVSETQPILENPASETKPEPVPENPKQTTKQTATDQPDSEGKKNVFGSRKASNPAFIAAQSRFEKLTSFKAKPDNEVNLCADIGPTAAEQATLVTDAEPRAVQNGDSECGTELSITSTLDSPDKFETINKKSDEVNISNDIVGDMNVNIDDNNNIIDVAMNEKQVNEKLNDGDIEPELELEHKSSHHVDKSNTHEPVVPLSVLESPKSHITNLESQGTPSSQISTSSKKTKKDKKASSQTQTRKSWSYSKKSSPVSSSVDSGLRTSLEQLPKETKPGKRRNVFGSPKPDHGDHEPSVPSYMQATESARAKVVANISPRSSPDVHDKDFKKRHSLPGAVNTRQGSPRVQRSMSQALQTTKGNGSQERKWQR